MLFSGWKLLDSLILSFPKEGSLDILDIVFAIIVFRVGDNLFSLKDIGRKFILVILGVNILRSILAIILVIYGSVSVTYTVSWLENVDGSSLYLAIEVAMLSLYILLLIMFLNPGVKKIFVQK